MVYGDRLLEGREREEILYSRSANLAAAATTILAIICPSTVNNDQLDTLPLIRKLGDSENPSLITSLGSTMTRLKISDPS
ncbi:hypothetical protein PM082_002053 [Marasmius tenuissimus]|nr:hypothetical protein PM082_002053 [Marasmius tenuissimus]